MPIRLKDILTKSALASLVEDEVESFIFEDFPPKIFVYSKKSFFIIEDDFFDKLLFSVQKFASLQDYKNGTLPNELKIDKKAFSLSMEIFPSGRLLGKIWGKKATKIERIDVKRQAELFFMAPILRDCVNIHFEDGTGETINLHVLGEIVRKWVASFGFAITMGTGTSYSIVKIFDENDVELGEFRNKKEYFTSFAAANKIEAILRLNQKKQHKE